MSIRDHLESQDVYLPRGCRRTEDAADRLRVMLTKAEDERDTARDHADALAGVLERMDLLNPPAALRAYRESQEAA